MRNLLFSFMILFLSTFVFGQATANFWTKKNDFAGGKRERAVGFSIGEYGYVGTGVDTAEHVLNDFWRYDPVMDAWQQMANLPGVPRRDAIGFSLGNKGYVGTGIDSEFSHLGSKMKDFYEYNPSTNSWTQKADFPGAGGVGIYFATCFTVDSKGYVCCGKIGPNSYSNQLWEYKPSTDQWTSRASFPGGVRYRASAFSIGSHGYVGLGADQDVFRRDFYKYSPGTNQWSQIADLPGSERASSVTFTIEDRGFVCMGTDGGILDDLWEYDPVSNHWAIRAFYGGSSRKSAVGFAINGKGYVGIGKGYSGKKQGFEEYTPRNFASLDELSDVNVKIYPNPTADKLFCYSESQAVSEFVLITTSGQIVRKAKSAIYANTLIPVDDLAKGIYLLSSVHADGTILSTQKVIIQ